jgi:hypothetical protein
MNDKIDLGATSKEKYGDLPTSVVTNAEHNDNKKIYPVLHYSGVESLDLPKSGTMTVKFKVVREVEEENENGDHYSCDIEIQEISDISGKVSAPTKSYKDGEHALDDILDQLMRVKQEEEDEGEKE